MPQQTFHLPKRLIKQYEAAIGQLTKKVFPPKLPEQTFEEWLADVAEASKRKDVQEASGLAEGVT